MNGSPHHLPRTLALLVPCPPILGACMGALELATDDSHQVLSRHLLDVASPVEPGGLGVRVLYYGSGTDKNRPEYRDSVAFKTGPVDASKLVSLGSSARIRVPRPPFGEPWLHSGLSGHELHQWRDPKGDAFLRSIPVDYGFEGAIGAGQEGSIPHVGHVGPGRNGSDGEGRPAAGTLGFSLPHLRSKESLLLGA